MKITCFETVKLQDIGDVWPQVQRFEAIKMDGLVKRESIRAAAFAEKGLQFEIPTPAPYMLPQEPGNQFPVPAKPLVVPFDYTPAFIRQIAEICGIDRGDLERESEKFPAIAADRINAWLHDGETLNEGRKRPRLMDNTQHLLRAYQADEHLLEKGATYGVLRAIRSDRFKLGLDVSDLLTVIMAVINERRDLFPGRVDFEAAVSDEKMHFVLTNHALTAATEIGDVVAASVAGSTSDIGNASLSIESRIVKLACKNGMRVAQAARYAHLGSKLETLPNGALSNRTKALQAASLSSELFDAIAYCFDEVRFKETVARMSANQKIACSPDQAKPVFEAIQVAVGLPDATKDAIFTHFCCERTPQGGNNYSKDGLVQAITAQGRAIATTVSYDKALPYEIMGGKLFEMPNEVFQELLPVAAASPKKAAKYFS